MKKFDELSKRIQIPVFVDPCPWHESIYLTARNSFPPQLFVPASDKTPTSYSSVVANFVLIHYTAVRKRSMIPAL